MRYSLLALLFLSSLSFAWLPGWDYMMPVNISNPGAALSDYQVRVDPNIYNTTGLVGSWHFSEGSGTLAADSSGSNNDGTFVSSPVWVSGKFGSGLLFDGLDDYVNVGNKASARPTSALTMEAWVKVNTSGSTLSFIGAQSGTGWGAMIRKLSTNAVQWNMKIGGIEDRVVTSVSTLSTGVWYHLALTYNGSVMTGYINGVPDGSSLSVSGTINWDAAYNTLIGSGQGSSFMNGTIDEVRIYNRSLSLQEIQEHYNATKARLDYADLRFTQPYTIYETPISLSGTGSDLVDYQVLINITDQTILSHMRSDGADLRFFSSATSTPYSSSGLPYWLESINSSQAKVWVKANVSSGGSTVYMYYGNSSASPASNGSATFILFDDFKDGDYTSNPAWTYIDGTTSASLGYLEATGEAYTNGGNIKLASTINTGVWEHRVKLTNIATGNFEIFAPIWASTGNSYSTYIHQNGGFQLNKRTGGVWSAIISSSWTADLNWHTIKLTRSPAGLMELFLDGVSKGTVTDNDHTTTAEIRVGNVGSIKTLTDDIRIRKYSATEPSATIGSEAVSSSGLEASLPYWLESDMRAWVKVPSIPADASSINMYYGSPSASPASNGSATFDFFDDFDGVSLDTGKWTIISGTGYSVANSILTTTNVEFNTVAKNFGMISNILESKITESNAGNTGPANWRGQSGASEIRAQWYSGYGGAAWVVNNGAIRTVSRTALYTNYDVMGIRLVDSTTVKFYKNYDEIYSFAPTGGIVTGSALIDIFTSTTTLLTDWVRVRRSAWPEPTSASGAEQQSDATPPSISISSPANVSYPSMPVPVAFTVSDDVAVGSCVVRLNSMINSSSCSNYSLALGNGAYILNITANDTSGNSNSSAVSFTVDITVSVSNSTTTDSLGIGNVSLSGIPPAASSIVYSVGSNSYSKSFSTSSGVSSVRISARATLQGTPASGRTLAFSVS